MTENQKEMHKCITDTQTGMQDLIVQTINPLIGKVNAVQRQEQEISAVKEDLKNLVGQVEQGFKILTVAAKSQLAHGEMEGSVPPNPPGHGAEGTCHTLQVPQAGGGGGPAPPIPPLKVEVGASMEFVQLLHAIESTKNEVHMQIHTLHAEVKSLKEQQKLNEGRENEQRLKTWKKKSKRRHKKELEKAKKELPHRVQWI